MFGSLLRLNQLTIGIAAPAAHAQVLKLVHDARFRLIQFGRTTLSMPAAHVRIAVAWHHTQPVATLIATTTSARSAWIRCCAIAGIHFNDHDAVVAALANCLVQHSDVDTLYYSSDHADCWLADILQGVGFTSRESIIALERPRHHHSDTRTPPHIATMRPLHITDMPSIQAIDAVAFSEQWHKIPYEVHDLFHHEHYGMVASCDQQVVAYTLAAVHDQQTALHLVRIAVHPTWQGRGIAKQLLADIVRHAQQKTMTRITLNTQDHNHVARRLYEQFGFVTTNDRYDVYAMDTLAT